MSFRARLVRAAALAVLCVVPVAIGCSGSSSTKPNDVHSDAKVTEENYKKIKKDMTREEVEKILGKGDNKTSLKVGDTSGDGVVYTGEKHKVEVIYKDDKVLASHISDKAEPKAE